MSAESRAVARLGCGKADGEVGAVTVSRGGAANVNRAAEFLHDIARNPEADPRPFSPLVVTNGSKISSSFSGLMPVPVSEKISFTSCPSAENFQIRDPPWGIASMALEMRLVKTWRSSPGVTSIIASVS